MGQTGSSMVKKLGSTIWGSTPASSEGCSMTNALVSPYVLTRRGSMFFDEDGDLAHEFYEEVIVSRGGCPCSAMRRKRRNLIPQGEVELSHPRLHVDFPVVLCETPGS